MKAHFMAYQAGVKVSKAFDLSAGKLSLALPHVCRCQQQAAGVAVNDNTLANVSGRYLKLKWAWVLQKVNGN